MNENAGVDDQREIDELGHERWVERGSLHGRRPHELAEAERELHAEKSNCRRGGDGSHLGYRHLLKICSRRIPYVPLIACLRQSDLAQCYAWHEVDIEIADGTYQLPPPFLAFPLPTRFQDMVDDGAPKDKFRKCRLESYRTNPQAPPGFRHRLSFSLSSVSYLDYLRSGEHLDRPVPSSGSSSGVTFRTEYMPEVPVQHDYRFSPLTNICGVGIFLISADNKLILSEQSGDITVFPGAYSYTASGTMDWNPYPNSFSGAASESREWQDYIHPFQAVSREAFEEVAHEVHSDSVRLFGFGIDAEKLYFQFSFFERTHRSSKDIIEHAALARDFSFEKERLEAVNFDLPTVVKLLKRKRWEPSAEAALVSLCCGHFGFEETEWAIDQEHVRNHVKDAMCPVWDERARREDVRAVMSADYPTLLCPEASIDYVSALMGFIGQDMDNSTVLEVGCGIGRITRRILDRATALTCIDLSSEMMQRCKRELGGQAERVDFFLGLAQDYPDCNPFDVALCSLVLIHNVHEQLYRLLIERLGALARCVFVAEHVEGPRRPSVHTRVRTTEQLIDDFQRAGFELDRRGEHMLFTDRIAFLKFVRKGENRVRGRPVESRQEKDAPREKSPPHQAMPQPAPPKPKTRAIVFEVGGFSYGDRRYVLTRIPWLVLQTLVEAAPRAVTKEALLSKVWNDEAVADDAIRQAIGAARRVWRQALMDAGYQIKDPIPSIRGGFAAWVLKLPEP